MSLAGRIRIYLIVVAVLPPLIVMAVIYFHSARQAELVGRQQAYDSLQKYLVYIDALKGDIENRTDSLRVSGEFENALRLIKTGRADRARLDPRPYGLNFMEILDSNYTVLATYHRPGLLAQKINNIPQNNDTALSLPLETMEYDIQGGHPALTYIIPVDKKLFLYTGRYIDDRLREQLAELMDADITLSAGSLSGAAPSGMEPGTLYHNKDLYQAVLAGGEDREFYLMATFDVTGDRPLFVSLIKLTGLVAFFSVLIAVALGFYITGRAKREIDNLVAATSRVASGDFNTPVMAYEEGEFAQLADSFTEMTVRLKALKRELATVEKIAAWETIGRKIAHEIKNPLTPISISVDDLRRSYYEKLPDFGKILEETTATIKSEVTRLTQLLNEFVSFARMKAPTITDIPAASFLDGIRNLYKHEILNGRLDITDRTSLKKFRFDPEAVKQVLINLIKNGFEVSDDSTVTVAFSNTDNILIITVEDTGPGFSAAKLSDSFEPFASTKVDGSGLGLVICHRLVHDLGGTMELYNRKQGGAGVKITLPL
ncbi:MAG: HAMP domain-containing protein [candidate division Zixibacteria bacterium]|nr:HAMP domain-containing protein [candidate division Zixibacteria bacterium]